MLFVDDIILVDELKEGMNAKLKRLWETLKFEGFKISHTETEYINYNFSGNIYWAKTSVAIEAQEILWRDSFHYIALIISNDEEISEDVKQRIKRGWLKFRLTYGVLYYWWVKQNRRNFFTGHQLDQLWPMEQMLANQ